MVTKLERVLVRRPEEAACRLWDDYGWRSEPDFKKLLREMHDERLIELASDGSTALILPPGDKIASDLIAKRESV